MKTYQEFLQEIIKESQGKKIIFRSRRLGKQTKPKESKENEKLCGTNPSGIIFNEFKY